MLPPVKLGKSGPSGFPIALGCMGMSSVYGSNDETESLATIRMAIDRGINLIDTGDFYDMGRNELLVREGIKGQRDKVHLSVKFGAMRGPDGGWLGVDARPAAVKNFCAYSLRRLGVDHIDVYRPSRLDPNVPIEDTVGAVADLVKAGYVRHIGLSEVGPDTIRRAYKVHPITDLQIEYAIVTRGPERAIFPTLAELGMSATLYGVYSRGLLTGSKPSSPRDFRAHMPRFKPDAAATNDKIVAALRDFAAPRKMTAGQVLLSWVLAKQPGLVPVVGARTRAQLEDALGALEKPLSAADVAALEALVPPDAVAGTRYAAEQMRHLDSEK
jgi:aryl-alcohol dehydrogenase-like predicted oxidoreductase